MKFAFIAAKEVAFPVVAMCRVLGVSRSGYYASANRPPSAHAKADGQLAVEIAAAHRRSRRRYGSPRVHRALRKKGIRVGKKRVERVMREKGIVARQKRRFRRTTDSKHASPIAPNVLARDFEPKAPNQAWAGDVTYIATDEGWAYLAVLLDLYSRRVVGWAMSTTNDTELALAALHRAVATRHVLPAGVVHHTDRGSPGGFNRSSQRLTSEELRWVHRDVDDLIAQDAVRSVPLDVRRPGDANTEKHSGRRLLAGWRVTRRRSRRVYPRRLERDGFVRMAACRRPTSGRFWGATYHSRNAKRSRSWSLSALEFARSRGGPDGAHPRFHASYDETRQLGVADSSIARQRRSGTQTERRGGRRWQSSLRMRSCASTCRAVLRGP